jgi:hypothetical protein
VYRKEHFALRAKTEIVWLEYEDETYLFIKKWIEDGWAGFMYIMYEQMYIYILRVQ